MPLPVRDVLSHHAVFRLPARSPVAAAMKHGLVPVAPGKQARPHAPHPVLETDPSPVLAQQLSPCALHAHPVRWAMTRTLFLLRMQVSWGPTGLLASTDSDCKVFVWDMQRQEASPHDTCSPPQVRRGVPRFSSAAMCAVL